MATQYSHPQTGFQPFRNGQMFQLYHRVLRQEQQKKVNAASILWGVLATAKKEEARPRQTAILAWRKVLRDNCIDILNPCRPGSFVPETMQVVILFAGRSYQCRICDLPQEAKKFVRGIMKTARQTYWAELTTLKAIPVH